MSKQHLCFYITLFCFLTIHEYTVAQVDVKSYRAGLFNKYAVAKARAFTAKKPYYIVAWEENVPQNLKIIRRLDQQIAIVELKNQQAYELLKQHAQVANATDEWKLSPSAASFLTQNDKEQQFILSSFNIDSLLTLLQDMKATVKLISINRPSRSVVVKTTAALLKDRLLQLREVIFVDVRVPPHIESSIIGYDRSFDGINAVDYSIPGANGHNVVLGVKEQKMDSTDLDLYKRVSVSSIASDNISNHATAISTLIGGAGNSYYDGRGIAYACQFFPSSFDNLFADDPAVLNANNVTVQNHSYGTIIQQFYGAEAVSYDAHTSEDKNFIHVFSAGNEGTSAASTGRYANIPGYANLTGNFKTAKNIITVGAIDNKENIPALSSSGPLYDGRLAPQLIALGPNGTSDAAAVVSGTIAVMQQVYKDSNNQTLPSASLIKAALYNTAQDVYTTGIDYKTGYGLVNSYDAIRSVQQKEYDGAILTHDQSWTKTITVPVNAAQLKITLSWTDSTAAANNDKALINDLDLDVQQLSTGVIYKPWVLNTAPDIDSLSQLPTRKRDSLNTAEQVSIQLPAKGDYRIKVIGTSVSTASLPFYIAYHVDTLNTFHFTSPQHASDVNTAEDPNVYIRWKTFVADTNQTGALYISYNKGTDWQLLQQACKLYTNKYQWLVKDTNSTAMLKMQTSFGIFFSKEFIISQVIRPAVDFLCTDSFRLSWNKHIYANAYRIYTLTDSPYLKPILTVSDTFIVMKRAVHPQLVYAVEPLLSNDVSAARSIAIDINQQGVKCFYKTLYYNLFSENTLELVLELGAVSYVDSVFFEQVTAGGQLLQAYGGTKTNISNIYKQMIADAPAGNSFWRARIQLKSGAMVYTEIITVLTSGRKYILFYPNPVSGNRLLQYILQQDLPPGTGLRLLDITGRLLKDYIQMPDVIDLRAFAPGVYVYKLFSGDQKVLETGKLVVQ